MKLATLTQSIAHQLIYAQGKDIVIPSGFTNIDFAAFYNERLTSVIIPVSITSIGASAFSINRLTDVVIPDSVLSIGAMAFDSSGLLSVDIGDNVVEINNHAFSDNELSSIDIPDSVTTIEDGAFSGNQLTSVSIPNSVTTIGHEAFSDNQIKVAHIGDNVQSISTSTFLGNPLEEVVIPENPLFNLSSFLLSLPPGTTVMKRGLQDPITENLDNITGLPTDDAPTSGESNDAITGGEGADKFVFQKPDKFGKKNAIQLLDFDPISGDSIFFDKASFDLGKKIKLKIVASKKALRKASRTNKDFVYHERKGFLYYNEDGKDIGWGEDGGLFVILQGAPELAQSNFTIA